ncbi:MAG: DUF4258 domain-containing protein [Lentisphaerae bacterium]|nr:DUF4258 domain-containing protein [Lentisphaerota bacterium]
MRFDYSRHAEEELTRRGIARATADAVLRSPGQIVFERAPRKAYQSKVDLGGRMFLVRLIVDESTHPAVVVTAYRTSKIAKYWRRQ